MDFALLEPIRKPLLYFDFFWVKTKVTFYTYPHEKYIFGKGIDLTNISRHVASKNFTMVEWYAHFFNFSSLFSKAKIIIDRTY